MVWVPQYCAALGCQSVDRSYQFEPVDLAGILNLAPDVFCREESLTPGRQVKLRPSLDPLPAAGLELDHSIG